MSASDWIEKTNAIGIFVRRGRYGGTYAHKDIAFEFASAISPVFKLYLIKEFQRLKAVENDFLKLEWSAKRFLSKNNYLIQTDAVKNYLIPSKNFKEDMEWIAYAEEADLLVKYLTNRWEKKEYEINLPSTKMTRFTKFGYGNRYDFTKASKDHKSEFCDFKSDFDPKHPHGPSYTFGVGRDKFAKVYLESNKMLDMKIPGPGKYYNPPPFGKGGICYSFRGLPEPKKEIIEKRQQKYPQPGPGEYPVTIQINGAGKYAVSQIENVSTLKIIKPKENTDARFSYSGK